MNKADPTRPAGSWLFRDYAFLALWFVPAAILTWGIHESAHYATGLVLGYDMWISFNQVGPVEGSSVSKVHQFLITMSGPLITWIQAVVAFVLIRQTPKLSTPNLSIYPFLFLTLWTRALAMFISFVSHPNDEARASLLIGCPVWLIPSISVGLMFGLTFYGSRGLNVGWKGNIVAYLAASLVTAAIVFSDQILFAR